MKTKTSALTALRAAGFNAQLNAAGLRVWGDNWEAQFTDLGQDHDTFAGDVPAQVHELAVWDDPFARAEYAILNEHSGDYITRVNWEANGSADTHGTDDPAQATTYTRAEAESLVAELGRGFAIELKKALA
jgi:hypothetical protein